MSSDQFHYYLSLLWTNIRDALLLEWIGVLCAVAQVLLAWANKASNYFFGIISSGVYVCFFAIGGLFADAGLNAYYLIMSIYGLWHWHRGRQVVSQNVSGAPAPPSILPITFSRSKDRLIAAGIAAAVFGLWSVILTNLATSKVPFWDASLTALACSGMWLLARRKVENWLWLNASNAVAMPLYFFKGWMLTTVLTAFLFIVAIAGYFRWRRLALAQTAASV